MLTLLSIFRKYLFFKIVSVLANPILNFVAKIVRYSRLDFFFFLNYFFPDTGLLPIELMQV